MKFDPIPDSVSSSGRYRIVSNGEKFRIQERFLYFFWSLATYSDKDGEKSQYYEYNTREEAEARIGIFEHQDQLAQTERHKKDSAA